MKSISSASSRSSRAGKIGAPRYGVERRLREDLARHLRALEHHLQVEAFGIAEVVRFDARLVAGAVARQHDAAAAARAQEAGMQRCSRRRRRRWRPWSSSIAGTKWNWMSARSSGASASARSRRPRRCCWCPGRVAAQVVVERDLQVADAVVGDGCVECCSVQMSRWSCRFAPTPGASCTTVDAVPAQLRPPGRCPTASAVAAN